MKKHLLLFVSFMLSACINPLTENEENNQTNEIPVNIEVRSSGSTDIVQYYPLSIFVFNEDGEYISRQDISESDKSLSTILKPGKYNISALGGLNSTDYSYPSTPSISDIITLKNSYSLNSPLMSGHYEIDLTRSSDIILPVEYRVSTLNFKFYEIPSDATAVSVSVSPLSNGYTFDGKYTDSSSQIKIDCTRNNELWEYGPLYVFPSGSNSINLTVNVSRESGTETFSYTHPKALEASRPYTFIGTYNEGIRLEISFDIEEWLPGIDVDYDLIQGTTSTDIPTLYSDYLPEENSIWRSFYVWTTKEISATEIEAVVIAPQQWSNVYSSGAEDILKNYVLEDISDWRTFTKAEASEFYKNYSEVQGLSELNKLLYENGHNTYYINEGNRYLCENAEYTFRLYSSIDIRKAGEKKGYYLRALKTIMIKLK